MVYNVYKKKKKSIINIKNKQIGKDIFNMKFVKGMLIGSMVSVGIIMLCNENMNMSKKRMIKKANNMLERLG